MTVMRSLAQVIDVKPSNCFLLRETSDKQEVELEDIPLEISKHAMIGTLSPQNNAG